MKRWSLIAALLLLSAPAGRAAPPPEDGPVVVTNATVIVGPGKRIDKGTVVIQDGRIAQVGTDVRRPSGARVIDGTGMFVTAGIVDAYDTIGLIEVDLEESSREGQFKPGDDGIHAAYRVTDGYNPRSVGVQVARTGGITSVVAVPRGGLVSGQAAWLSLAHGRSTPELVIRPVAGVHVTLGEGSLVVAEGSRGVAVERLRELLDDARQYVRRRAAFEKRQTRDFAASRLDLEALAGVVGGRVPLIVRADRASDILAAIAVGRELGVRIVIAGGSEAWMVADDLARARVPVLVDPTRNLPASFDQLHVRNDGPAILRSRGVQVIVSVLGEAPQARTLRQLAGVAVAYGMSWDDAFAALTSTPAEVFGEPGRGTLERGTPADVVVWSGDPLELSSRPLHVFIDGVEQPLESHQTRLLRKYEKLDEPTR